MLSLLTALLISLGATSDPLVVMDMEACLAQCGDDTVLRYDTFKFVASLQGVVNRDAPRLVIRFLHGAGQGGDINVDDYWLGILGKGWLKDRPIEPIDSLEQLLAYFPESREGVVLWDPKVLATANLAATICGVEGWLPIRSGSVLQQRLVDEGPRIPVRMSLVDRFDGSESGSAKCDAYLWAKREYLDKGRCNDSLLAYFIDAYSQRPGEPGFHYSDLANATLANHDYYIARRAFFFDLGPWGDEVPVDDPGQPMGTDRKTFIAILNSLSTQNKQSKIATVGGFTPWNLKYTTHGAAGGTHDPVPTEWEHAAIVTAHNAVMDADALGLSGLANASAYRHYPVKDKYTQPRPEPRKLEAKTYVLVYMGDYDSAAWLSRQIPSVWDDPARGTIPMAWAFNPNLVDRVPYVFDYVYATRTDQDWFIGGDSGAGYLNPNLLIGDRLGSGLPDALDLWIKHNQHYYGLFDYTITGFVINGFHGKMPLRIQEAYARFSPDGVGMQLGFEKPVVNGTPFLRHARDIYPKLGHLEATADEIAAFSRTKKPHFLIFRMILQKPSTVKGVYDILREKQPNEGWEFCDPYTFFDLYKQHLAAQDK